MASRLSDAIKDKSIETGFEAHPAQLVGVDVITKFILGGNAIFTVVNTATGNRFTYRIQAPKERKGSVSHFVSVLTGPDNTTDYTYVGQIYHDALDSFTVGRKSPIGNDAMSVKALKWLIAKLVRDDKVGLGPVQVFHEARCGRCARKLTVPSSIASGFGPECVNHV